MRGHARLIVAVMVLGTVVGALPAAAKDADGPAVAGAARFGDAGDFASERLGDPWDYATLGDVLTDEGPTTEVVDLRVDAGVLRWSSDNGGSLISPHYMPVPGALPSWGDGMGTPIDPDHYTHLSLHVYTSEPGAAALMWFRCPEYRDECLGAMPIHLRTGWQTVIARIDGDFPGLDHEWVDEVHGLRLVFPQTGDIAVDWLRIFRPTGTSSVTWDGGQLAWEADRTDATSPHAPSGRVHGASSGRFELPHGALPPGQYRFGPAGSSERVHVEVGAGSRPVVLEPNAAGGADYATVELGDPWDLAGPSDVIRVAGSRDVRYEGGQLHATNDGNDPFVQLRLGARGVDTDRYHRLTVRTSYDGPFDLADAPGGGTHGRLLWWRADTGDWVFHNSREILTYTDRDTYHVDLATDPVVDVQEPGDRPRLGWSGANVTYLRYDPNEDRGDRRWRLDEVRLAADDEPATDGRFTVRWRDDVHVDGTLVDVVAGRDADVPGGVRVARGLAQRAGDNAWTWDTRDALPGRWWLTVEGRRGDTVGRGMSSGPVRVPPRIAGSDRIATAVGLSRSSFAAGAETAVVALADDFPDALAAAPLAGAVGGPVLLNTRNGLRGDVADELRRLGVGRVLVLGGERAQSSQVVRDLQALGIAVERISGRDRYATAAAAAMRAVDAWRSAGHADAGDEVLVALGTDFADALAAGPLAIHARQPLLLVPPDHVPDATRAALDALAPERVTVIGGTAAIPESTARQLDAAGRTRDRIGGRSRYHTAQLAGEAAVGAGADRGVVLVAVGSAFPDALAAGPAVAARGGVLVVTGRDAVPPEAAASLDAARAELRWMRVAGGRAAVSEPVVLAVLGRLGIR